MANICGVYKITNTIDGKLIIGISSNIRKRWNGHKSELRRGIHKNSYLQRAWNKYGESCFVFEIILECQENSLEEEEKRLIKKYDSINRKVGYNLVEGGYRPKHTKESKQKLRLAHLGKHHLEETKQKIRIAHLGKHHSKETKQKLKMAHQKRLLSKEYRQKLKEWSSNENNAMYGKHHSEETKKKISKSKLGKKLNLSEEARRQRRERVKGENNPFFHKHHSKETKLKMKEAWVKRQTSY